MPKGHRPSGPNRYFPKVKEAREALQAEALDLFNSYKLIIQGAIDKGDFETAGKLTQWLIEHMPQGKGESMVDISIDKPKQVESGPRGPQVLIGFGLGGINPTKELPAVTVDVQPVEVPDTESNQE